MSVLLFLENNNSQGSVQKPIWQRKRTRFLVFAAAIALLIVLAFEGISLFWPHPAGGNLVSFVCSPSSSNQAFIVNAKINLTDGMDQDEAMEVANKVLLGISQQTPQLLYTKSNHDEKGMWTVEFIYIYTMPYGKNLYNDGMGSSIARKSLTVTIDPFDQTVKYYG
jgi:hypothetical protein